MDDRASPCKRYRSKVYFSVPAGSIATAFLQQGGKFKNGIKWVVSGHNMIRGTFGNTLLNAELLAKKGLL